jgi:outer membrane biosynthesis protein TonB
MVGGCFLLWLLLCLYPSYSKAVDCDTDTLGLCTPTIEQIIEESSVETIEFQADGILTTTETTTTTTTTTVTNEDSGDILDGDNGYVVSSKEGDMDIDWGGQGSASMPSGSTCGQLGTDKCAMITGSGNSTSMMGVPNMGTTFINTVDISDLNFTHGGRTNYEIKVFKPDAQDSIYMHITGRNGKTDVFSGTDILSASGTNSQYGQYSGGFDFTGSLTSIIVEVGGRDINMAVGVMFDDVKVNVLYNVVNTIVEQTITSVEMFVALNTDAPEEVLDVVEDIFESNTPIETDVGLDFEPIEIEEISYESVEIEIAEIEIEEIQVASIDMSDTNVEVNVIEVEAEVQMELEMELETEIEIDIDVGGEENTETATESTQEPEQTESNQVENDASNTNEEPTEESVEETTEESNEETNEPESKVAEKQSEKEQESQQEKTEKDEKPKVVQKKSSSKEKAAKKVMKKIDDKKRYDESSQIKTLVVMQVLGNTKTFFESQQIINDRAGFFTDDVLPDAVISDNDMAGYFLFVGSDGLMNEIIDSQYK